MKTLTEAQRNEIIRLYKLKVENKNIAIILNLKTHQVNNFIYKYYLVENPRVKNTCNHFEYSDEVIKLYRLGYSYKKISEQTGLNKYQIVEIIKLIPDRRKVPVTIKQYNEILQNIKNGTKLYEISDNLNLNYSTIHYWARKIRERGLH